MSETKWTPGPWAYDGCNVVDSAGGVVATSGLALAHGYVPVDDVTRYNDRLIAAAPDLYRALEALPLEAFDKEPATIDAAEFVDHAHEFYEAMVLARAALSKARGESA